MLLDLSEMEKVFFIIGGIIFLFILFFLLKRILRKKKQIIYAIKKVTSCKDSVCHDSYMIQGIDKYFKTFEEAKQYTLFLKNGRR